MEPQLVDRFIEMTQEKRNIEKSLEEHKQQMRQLGELHPGTDAR